jgi:lysophospholipase L1-like esterase
VLLESHRPLDLVVVMLGTNDLKARFGASASDIALGVERLIVEVQRSDAGPDAGAPDVMVAAPCALQETGIFAEVFAGAAARSLALPAALATVATRHGAGFFDAGTVASVDPVDGIHLDAAGHAAIGAGLATAVRQQLASREESDAQGN